MAAEQISITLTDGSGNTQRVNVDGVILGAAIGSDTTAALQGHFGQEDLVKALAGIHHVLLDRLGEPAALAIIELATEIAKEANKSDIDLKREFPKDV